jgi:hypothetical protein
LITLEHRAVNDESHTGSSVGLLVILVRQTVLHSTLVSPVAARKITMTLTGNSTDLQTTPTNTGGASRIPTPTLAVASTKTAVASTHSLMTYEKPTMDAFSSHEDRLTRFGYSYLERYFDCYGVSVTVIEDETDKSAQEELGDDLIKLVASFSGKLYGMRSSKKHQVVNTVETEMKPDE